MDVRHLTFILLFYLASGFFVSMGVLRPAQMGYRYYLYHGLGAAVLALGAWFVLGNHEITPYIGKAAFWFVIFCAGYSMSRGRRWWFATFFYILGTTSAIYVLVADLVPVYYAGSKLFPNVAYFLINGLLSALLLGFTMAAMIVGHWYLVQPKLSINELKRTTIVFIILVLLRFGFSTFVTVSLIWGMGEAEIYRYLFGGYPGLFVTMRWFWGLLGPLILSYFIWNTVKIRSTQSATGILYVAVVCVLAGETLSQYLTFYYGIPL